MSFKGRINSKVGVTKRLEAWLCQLNKLKLKGNCMENKFYLGIDVGKYQHQATLINHHGAMVGQSVKFANSLSDFESFRQLIKNQLPKGAVVKAGMEATGHYYWHLRDYLVSQGIEVEVINPIETQIKAKTRIRKVKNDRIDSGIIAEITGRKDSKPIMVADPGLRQLRDLTRFAQKLKGQARFYKQEISTLIERVCPEFYTYFSNIFLVTAQMIIRQYFLQRVSGNQLVEQITKTSKGRTGQNKAAEIVLMLNNSIGVNYRHEYFILQLKMLVASLDLIQKQIIEVEKQIAKAAEKYEQISHLSSIKGVSTGMASAILSEIGSIDRFSNNKQLTAFAGLDASVKQSGRYLRKQGNHISKRGSKYLRKQLYYAAKTAVIFDPELKAYYQRKRAQGKHYNVVIIAVARKILMRIYAVLKQKRPYELRLIS